MGLCYNPRVFTPTPERLSLAEWQALQRFLFHAASIDPGAFAFTYPTPIDAAVPVLRALQGDAARFIAEVLPRAHAVGVTLADYGRDATQAFRAIIGLLDAGGQDVRAVLAPLDALQARASANAAAATSLFAELEAYLRRATEAASALDATVKSAPFVNHLANLEAQAGEIATLTEQRAASVNDDSHGKNTWWYDVQLSNLSNVPHDLEAFARIKALNDQLQGELALATPTLEHVMGAWSGIALELAAVSDNARLASAGTLNQQPCLAEIALTAATDEWNEVALDAAAFADAFFVKPA
jgi:hypothetical protein